MNGVPFHVPVTTTTPNLSTPAPSKPFEELGVPASLTAVLARRGITTPLPIQARTIPDALQGRDVLGRAETGSGKTLAFGLPLLVRTATAAGGHGTAARPSGSRPRPRALVLVPTRELARQVHDELTPLAGALGLRLLAVYGGASMRTQIQALRRGIDVVIATPGRLTDLLERGACSLDAIAIAVIDEADHMADMGFLPAVTWLLDRVPAGGQRLLFSATLDNGVDVLVRRYLADPVRHAVSPATGGVARMDHRFVAVTALNKVAVATDLAARSGRSAVGAPRRASASGVAAGPAITADARRSTLGRGPGRADASALRLLPAWIPMRAMPAHRGRPAVRRPGRGGWSSSRPGCSGRAWSRSSRRRRSGSHRTSGSSACRRSSLDCCVF